MSRDRPRTERAYDEEGTRPEYEGEDRSAYEENDSSRLPAFVPFGWPTVFNRDRDNEAYREEEYAGYDDENTGYERAGEDDDSWLDEGLIGLVLIAGVVLFLFPEPATSGLGVLLIAIGVVAWLIDWAM